MKLSVVIASVVVAGCCLSARAATPIDERHPVNPDVQVRIENVSGSVQVRAGAQDVVSVSGSLGEGARPLRVEGDRNRLTIRIEPLENGWGSRRMGESHLVVTMPRTGRVEGNTVSADIDVAGINGAVVELESVSGDVVYVGDAQRIRLKSVSGSVASEGAGRDWTLGTVSGDIRVPRAAGAVRAETVSGKIELTLAEVERARLESVSGTLLLSGKLMRDGSVAMQSVSGSIQLELAPPINARIRASTFSGRIDSTIGTPERAGVGGGYRLEATSGDAAGEVRVESFSGRIRIGGGS